MTITSAVMTPRKTVRRAGKWLRNKLLDAATTIERLADTEKAKNGAIDPFEYTQNGTLHQILMNLRMNPAHLLQARYAREVIATERAANLMKQARLKRVDGSPEIAFNAIEHNIQGAVTSAGGDRPSLMVNVVSTIERVWKNVSKLDVLTIGPRSEIEIFAILAAGFSSSRIKALDLFSYSPYVHVGDMHSMPYADDSFDVIFVGWVLAYSRNQGAAAREIFRVCRNRAIVVLAGDYCDETRDRSEFKNETTFMQTTDQLLALFEGHVAKVYFRHEPEQPEISMVMTVFEVSKP